MAKTTEQMLDEILKKFDRYKFIRSSDIPDIDLYMDQVTTFMEEHLKENRRCETDKIITKTMINNYAKNKLLPAPDRKKYSKEHMMVLIFIYYWKGFLSLQDISALLQPLTSEYFHAGSGINLESIYDEVFSQSKEKKEALNKSVRDAYASSLETFKDAPADKRDELQRFSLICSLAMEVYMKKKVIEQLIDKSGENQEPAGKQPPEKERRR